ncbi:MAG TPA: Ig-like domain-containing protein [Candidatus Acidoferrum sp.]|nr:Ig-like domain-containing protein [Candidatus Acidoferrum sp.]
MRKLAAALLAVPILATIYLPILLRRSIAARIGLALGIGGVLSLAALSVFAAPRTAATPPATQAPVASTEFGPAVRTGLAPNAAIMISFSRSMDTASVLNALTVSPAASTRLSWNGATTVLSVHPITAWATGTYYTISIGAAAADTNGKTLGTPLRAAFVTRSATAARITATRGTGPRADVRTTIQVSFDRPVDLAVAAAAFRIAPTVGGTFDLGAQASSRSRFTFTPLKPLQAKTTYRVSLAGPLVDDDGSTVDTSARLSLKTAMAPTVIRFRPTHGTTHVDRSADLSVRFSEPMSHKATAAAFSASIDGHGIAGKISWAEGDTVLVFDPSSRLPNGKHVLMTVTTGAQSTSGAALAATVRSTFKVVPTATAVHRSSGGTPIPHASGGSSGSGSWHAVEVYYLHLMNCTRTGGWVTSSGSCSSPGGLSTPPIVLDAGLSNNVSRPYAKLLATRGLCDHFVNGTPTDRLHRAGYSGWAAENIGCRSASNPYASVLGTHLYFQSEKPCGGYCHYANLMNPAYKRCGIGVWVYSGRVRLVIDFYHP